MKKSLFITIDFPPQIGGVATYIKNICDNFDNDKIFVLAQKNINSADFDKNTKYTIIRKNIFPKWHKAFFETYKIIKNYKIEIIHNSHILPIGYITLIIKFLFNINYITYLHGYDFILANKNKWKRFWLNIILRYSYKIIVNSLSTKNLVTNKFSNFEEKIIIVYPCANSELYEFSNLNKNSRIQRFQNKKILLTVARLVERKGHSLVLQALPQLIKTFPNLIYIIIGEGNEENNLKEIVKNLKLENYVEFIKNQTNENLVNYYLSSDIFIMPTKKSEEDIEGFGITFIEAGLFGIPVIGGKNGGVTESVQHGINGYLISNNSIDEIIFYVTYLLKNPTKAKELGLNGKYFANTKFIWQQQFNKIKNIL